MEGVQQHMNSITPKENYFSFDGTGAHQPAVSGIGEWVSSLPRPAAPPTPATTQPETTISAARGREASGAGCKEMIRGIKSSGRTTRKQAAAARPRFAFQTRSSDDVLDDGYRWRKYGQKAVKNSMHPRSYYRCTHHACNVKKQVQRLEEDTSVVVTTYEGVHNHPCEKLMEALAPLLKQLQFLAPVLGLF